MSVCSLYWDRTCAFVHTRRNAPDEGALWARAASTGLVLAGPDALTICWRCLPELPKPLFKVCVGLVNTSRNSKLGLTGKL